MRKDKVVTEVLGAELALTPSDLYNTSFRNALVGGYDKDEVDAFLERVGDVFESLINEVRTLREQQDALKGQLEDYNEIETALRAALTSSQKFSENITESARREADALIEEARALKARAQAEARRLPEALALEIASLKAERQRLREGLQTILDTHQALLERLETGEAIAATATDEGEGADEPFDILPDGGNNEEHLR